MPLDDPPGCCRRDCWGADACCNGVSGILVKFDGANKPANGTYSTVGGDSIVLSNVSLGGLDADGCHVGLRTARKQSGGAWLGTAAEYKHPDQTFCCLVTVGVCKIAVNGGTAETCYIQLSLAETASRGSIAVMLVPCNTSSRYAWWIRYSDGAGAGARPGWYCHLPRGVFETMQSDPQEDDDIDHAKAAQVKGSTRDDAESDCCGGCNPTLNGWEIEVGGLASLTVGSGMTECSPLAVADVSNESQEQDCGDMLGGSWYEAQSDDGPSADVTWLDEACLVSALGMVSGSDISMYISMDVVPCNTGANAGKWKVTPTIHIVFEDGTGEKIINWTGSTYVGPITCEKTELSGAPISVSVTDTESGAGNPGTLTVTFTPP